MFCRQSVGICVRLEAQFLAMLFETVLFFIVLRLKSDQDPRFTFGVGDADHDRYAKFEVSLCLLQSLTSFRIIIGIADQKDAVRRNA